MNNPFDIIEHRLAILTRRLQAAQKAQVQAVREGKSAGLALQIGRDEFMLSDHWRQRMIARLVFWLCRKP